MNSFVWIVISGGGLSNDYAPNEKNDSYLIDLTYLNKVSYKKLLLKTNNQRNEKEEENENKTKKNSTKKITLSEFHYFGMPGFFFQNNAYFLMGSSDCKYSFTFIFNILPFFFF